MSNIPDSKERDLEDVRNQKKKRTRRTVASTVRTPAARSSARIAKSKRSKAGRGMKQEDVDDAHPDQDKKPTGSLDLEPSRGFDLNDGIDVFRDFAEPSPGESLPNSSVHDRSKYGRF